MKVTGEMAHRAEMLRDHLAMVFPLRVAELKRLPLDLLPQVARDAREALHATGADVIFGGPGRDAPPRRWPPAWQSVRSPPGESASSGCGGSRRIPTAWRRVTTCSAAPTARTVGRGTRTPTRSGGDVPRLQDPLG